MHVLPCVISVAITGSVPTKRQNPAVPITVDEQIASTLDAYKAGAALVHVHVRDEQGLVSEPAFIRVLVAPNQAPVITPIEVETEFETVRFHGDRERASNTLFNRLTFADSTRRPQDRLLEDEELDLGTEGEFSNVLNDFIFCGVPGGGEGPGVNDCRDGP